MTSVLNRESQATLSPDSTGKTPRASYQSTEKSSNFHFDEDGHPRFDFESARDDLTNQEQAGVRRFPLDVRGDDHLHSYELRKSEDAGTAAASHQESSDESLRHAKDLDVDGLHRAPEIVYNHKRSRNPSSSLWIRDSRGRQVWEIGLDEGQYVTRSPHGVGNERNDAREEEPVQESQGDEEKGEEAAPKPVGFWHKSLNKTRINVFRRWAFMTALLSTFILAILSLYWAVLFKVDDNLNSIIVFVVNFETESDALVGPMVTQMTESIVEENKMAHLGFVTVPPSAYDYDHLAVREAIYQEEAFAAIVVNANATTLLREAVETGNSSYDPTGAIQLIYVEARDQDSYYDYIYPNMQVLQTQITTSFGEMWARQVLSNTSIPRTNLQRAPQAVSPGIGFSTYNLRPFVPYTALPAVSIGLIYLIIISFFSFSFFLPIHMQFISPGHPPLKFYQVVIWRWCATITAYLILSLAYSLVSLAFQIPFGQPTGSHYESATNPNAFGYGTFPVYWMINYVGMIALGMACENVAMIVGMPWTALWLIFWVITNVSTSFYAIETSPGFFRWGYAWPLHNIVEASRTVLFDLHSRLGLNFGVLFAWAAVNTALFPACCWFMRWKNMREKRKQG